MRDASVPCCSYTLPSDQPVSGCDAHLTATALARGNDRAGGWSAAVRPNVSVVTSSLSAQRGQRGGVTVVALQAARGGSSVYRQAVQCFRELDVRLHERTLRIETTRSLVVEVTRLASLADVMTARHEVFGGHHPPWVSNRVTRLPAGLRVRLTSTF